MLRITGKRLGGSWGLIAVVHFLLIGVWSPAASGQSIEETVKFITDMINTHGFVRSLDCRNPKATKPTRMTEVYTIIPTGAKLGLIELNHGRYDALTGFTQFNLHNIERVAYRAKDTEDRGIIYHAVQISCAGHPCVVKTTYCTGAVSELGSQFPEDRLFFRNASDAERVTKAFDHFLNLVQAQQRKSPF